MRADLLHADHEAVRDSLLPGGRGGGLGALVEVVTKGPGPLLHELLVELSIAETVLAEGVGGGAELGDTPAEEGETSDV